MDNGQMQIPVYDPGAPLPSWGSGTRTDAQTGNAPAGGELHNDNAHVYVLPWMGGTEAALRAHGNPNASPQDVAQLNAARSNLPQVLQNIKSENNKNKAMLCTLSQVFGTLSFCIFGAGIIFALAAICLGIVGLTSSLSDEEKKPALRGIICGGIYIFVVIVMGATLLTRL